MLIIGGMKSLSGAIIGAITVYGISEVLRLFETGVPFGSITIKGPGNLREMGLGLMLLLIMILRPRGITGGNEITWPFTKTGFARESPVSNEKISVINKLDKKQKKLC